MRSDFSLKILLDKNRTHDFRTIIVLIVCAGYLLPTTVFNRPLGSLIIVCIYIYIYIYIILYIRSIK